MSITVNLVDLEKIIEISQRVIDWKQQQLSTRAWNEFRTHWLPELVKQIHSNEFTWNDPNKNTAVWLIDQICHCRELVPGVEAEHCRPLADTALGEEVLAILRAMSRGQKSYDHFCQGRQFNNLFQ